MPTEFGKHAIGASQDAASASYELLSGPFTLTEDGTITAVIAYFNTFGVDQFFTPIIRPDSSGHPHATTFYTGTQTLSTNAATPQWLSMPLSQLLTAGLYWLGWLGDAGATNFTHDGEASLEYQTITYPIPNSPFSGTSVNEKAGIYATYTPAGAPSPPAIAIPEHRRFGPF